MIDLYTDTVRQNPYPAYEEIRRIGSAVYNKNRKVWHVGRYDDAVEVLSNSEQFSSVFGGFESTLIYTDGAAHDRARKLIMPAFSASRIKAIDGRLQELADGLASQAAEQNEFDFVDDLASKIPANVVAWMLGISDERVDDFRRWTEAIVEGGAKRLTPVIKKSRLRQFLRAWRDRPDERKEMEARATMAELEEFLLDHFEQSKHETGDGWVKDILTNQDRDDSLSMKEMIDIAMIFVSAGTETTADATASAAQILALNPSLQEQLRSDPELITPFIEEVLRFEPPLQRKRRITTCRAQIGDTTVPEGESIEVIIGSANRDPRKFEDADQFRLDRNPNPHITFGSGRHFCLGSQLARREAYAILRAVFEYLPPFELVRPDEKIEYAANISLRGPRHLRLKFS